MAGCASAILVGGSIVAGLRGVLPEEPLVLTALLVGIPLGGLCSLVTAKALLSIPRRLEAARRRRFESRATLTDDEFGRLFADGLAPIAVEVRAELGRFVGRTEVVQKLLPADPVRLTCDCVGVCRDDIDWAEFLFGMEDRFGVQLRNELGQEATVVQLVAGCAARGGQTGRTKRCT
jgi:hypothetical protein